jgi:hypothetical protein
MNRKPTETITNICLRLDCRLESPAMLVVEGFVQEKDFGDFQAQAGQLPAQLLEGMRAKPAGDQGADVFGAKLDLDGAARMKGERDVSDCAEMVADGAALAIGPGDQRVAFSHRERFQAIGAVRLPGDPVPEARLIGAAATRNLRKDAVRGCQMDTIHHSLPWN